MDLGNIPNDPTEIEQLVNQMDYDELLLTINQLRSRLLEDENYEQSIEEARLSLFCVRKLGMTRKTKKRSAIAVKKQKEEQIANASLTDLLKM